MASVETDALIDSVIEWGRDKKISDPVMQYAKVNEEIGEIAHELTRSRLYSSEMMDALGDTLVTIIILADILHFDIRDCLEEAYSVIKDRHGKTIKGSFVKDEM